MFKTHEYEYSKGTNHFPTNTSRGFVESTWCVHRVQKIEENGKKFFTRMKFHKTHEYEYSKGTNHFPTNTSRGFVESTWCVHRVQKIGENGQKVFTRMKFRNSNILVT